MPFDFNKSPLRIYSLWPQTPFPLEVSIYGYCQMACFYCFANRNRDAHDRELNKKNATANLFRRIDREIADEFSATGWFLREKHPICFSNTTDPFQREEKQYRSSEAFLEWAVVNRHPIFIQTKGNVLYEEFERYSKLIIPGKDVVYMSITALDDAVRRKIEPGALSIPKRWELCRMLSDRGIPVIAACNPFLKEWVPDFDEYCEQCKAAGVRGVWLDHLHFTKKQSEHIPPFYSEYVRKSDLLPLFLVNVLKQWYMAVEHRGLDFFPTPFMDAYFGHKAKFPECCDPEWVAGRGLPFAFDLVRDLSLFQRKTESPLVMVEWSSIAEYLQDHCPNPVLKTGDFWGAFNNQVSADRTEWKMTLGDKASLHEILRYFWNHPWECENFIWYHPMIQALFINKKNIYACDDDDNIIGIFNPANANQLEFTIDEDLIDWDSVIYW
jgi:DNA repair photolyase